MPTRAKLLGIINELRHGRTRLLPIAMAERVQHTIVRIEEAVASPVLDVKEAEALSSEARRLLDECAAFLNGI